METIRLINIQAADIYYHVKYEKEFIIEKPKGKFGKYYKEITPFNLDLYYLRDKGELREHKLNDDLYSSVFVNVSFKYSLYVDKKGNQSFKSSDEGRNKIATTKELREYLYLNGFTLNGHQYVRYKRSSGASREGSCLFILKKLYNLMNTWSNTGLDPKIDKKCYEDITSFEAYRSLSLSDLCETLKLEPKNITKNTKKEIKGSKMI